MENKNISRKEFLKFIGGALALFVISKIGSVAGKDAFNLFNKKNASPYGKSSYGGIEK